MSAPLASRFADVLLDAVIDGAGLRSPDRLMALLAAKAVELAGCDMSAVRIPDAEGATLRVATVHGIEGISAHHAETMRSETIDLDDIRSSTVQPGPRSPSAEAFLGGRIQVVEDIAGATRTGFTMRAMTAVPLIHAGRPLGVLTLYWRRRHAPDPQEREDLLLVGHHIALALDIAHRAAALRRRGDDLAEELDREVAAAAQLQAALHIALGALAALGGDADPVPAVLALTSRSDSGAGPIVAHAATVAVSAAHERVSRDRADDAVAAGAALLRLCRGGPDRAAQDAAAALGLLRECPLVLLTARCIDDDAAYRAVRTLTRSAPGEAPIAAADLAASVVVLCAGDDAADALATRALSLEGVAGVGISERFARWQEVPRAQERAGAAAQLSVARGTPVRSADVSGLADVAAALEPAVAARIAADVLEPLQRHDAGHRTELVSTLRAYLDCDGSATLCGARLHVHPNTVKQRIDRIERLLGSSLRDYRTISRVALALSWNDLLHG
ncbi:helix-turn-helix domain-containing protein [Microbacterium sp.]|uniref:helix-turn-helix domain-containing protein n=1 Tax=Microbacterium sp. TaxID=51671 RepID=UPI0039E6D43D